MKSLWFSRSFFNTPITRSASQSFRVSTVYRYSTTSGNIPRQLGRGIIPLQVSNSCNQVSNPFKLIPVSRSFSQSTHDDKGIKGSENPSESVPPVDPRVQPNASPPLPVQPVNIPGGPPATFSITNNPSLDAALTTIIGLSLVFIGGVAYVEWYKRNVISKMEKAFAGGYDPALELAKRAGTTKTIVSDVGTDGQEEWANLPNDWDTHLRRKEQDLVDRIVSGKETGRYYVFIGCKGAGKGTMIFDAMDAISAEGVSICNAHPDLEVFRLRLGKALNFEYNEDTQTGLFQRRDPREGGPALDIERALNKLEKVALSLSQRKGRPLVLIMNNVHLFRNDDAGQALLLQLQQRAESWSESGILTMIFSTDDFWPFLALRKTANRMQVVSIYDLSYHEATQAFTRMRHKAGHPPIPEEKVKTILDCTGGRLAYLSKVARTKDPMTTTKHLLANEKGWLLSQIGLIPDCDDDVMDEQKWSSCSWLLLREFVKLHLEQKEERDKAIACAGLSAGEAEELPLPAIPYWKCRQIMTRPDFLEGLDHANIISIDVHHDVRPDSMLILHAALEVVQDDGFDELLDSVRNRVDEIESLHRTRELTFKDLGEGDLLRLAVDKDGRRNV
ncbi:hypothetical protein K439DRAFT_1634041 [Ramaria rubella]|nr:hypothetical protein K439DRAFT_1634041 [Ramaria rubella]